MTGTFKPPSAAETESLRDDLHPDQPRGRAAEYRRVIEWLDSSLRWSRDGDVTTPDVQDG